MIGVSRAGHGAAEGRGAGVTCETRATASNGGPAAASLSDWDRLRGK